MVAIFTGLGAGFTRGSGNLLGGAGQLGSSLLGRGGDSVSVNAATGNLLVSHQDEFLVGLGPDVAISRTYNSFGDAADGDNGDNWQQSTTRRIFGLTGTLNSAGSTISRLGSDGSVVVYEWDASRSAYLTKDGSGAFDTLAMSGSEWVWTDGDSQAQEFYEAAQIPGEYRIRAGVDTDGNALTFTYVAGTDQLDKVTTADGGWTQYGWNGNAITQVTTGYTDLATSTAKTLTRVRYDYDGQGRLQTVTTDLTPGDNAVSDANAYLVTYTYDGASNRIASIAQSDGSLLQVVYDGSGRVQTLTQTVASGVTRVTTLTYGAGYTEVTGPDGQVTRLDYDVAGRLTQITAPPAYSGATAQTVQFAYDADGNLDTVMDGAGKVTSYDYDANGNATLVTDATGNTVSRTYDAQNRLITSLTSGADRDGASVAHYSQYVYDGEGHLRFAVNAAGQTTEYRYTAAGQLARTIQYAENRMTPPGATAISLATAEAWVAGIADKSSVRVTDNSYDARGNLISTTTYADLGINRVRNSEFSGSTGWTIGYDPSGIADGSPFTEVRNGKPALSLDFSATANNQVISLATAMGSLISLTGGERLSAQMGIEATGPVGRAEVIAHYYDKNGDYIWGTVVGQAFGPQTYDTKITGDLEVPNNAASMRFELYIYTSGSGAGSLSVIEPIIAQTGAADGSVPEYVPGLGGYVGRVPDASFSRQFFTYDQTGQLIESWREGENHETFFYDGMGRLYQSTDRNGGTTTIVFVDASTTTTVTNAAGFTSVSVYNKAGELVSVTQSGANTVGGTSSYQYDAAGRLRVVTDASGRKAYFYYDKVGRKVAAANHLGEVTEYRYDAAGRVVATIAYSTALAGSALVAMGDPAGTADFSTLRPSANAADIWGWTIYDDAGRVIQAIDNLGSTVRYEYDSEGKLAKTTAYFNKLSSGTLSGFRTTPPATLQLPATHAKDAVSRVFYNKAGQQIGTLDAEGFLTETIRDGTGLELQTTAYAAATNSADRASGSFATLKAGISTSNADQTGYLVYDGQGLLRFSVNARGGIVGYSYDTAGRLVRTIAYAREVALTDFTYDAVKAAVIANAADRSSWTIYDTAGRAAYTVDAEGGVTAFKYDAAGRVTKAVAYDNSYGSTISLSALDDWVANSSQASDSKNRVSRNWYSERGELLYSVDAEGYVSGYTYDAEGRVLSTTRFGGSTVTVGDSTTITQVQSLVSGVDAANKITVSQTYDNVGRVLTVTDGMDVVTRNTYNALGQLVDVIEAYGTTDAVRTHYDYDGVGRLVGESFGGEGSGSANYIADVEYAYDGLGNRVSATDARGNSTTYTYDRLGRVLTATNALSGATTFVYDAFGQVVKVTDPRGKSTFNYYDRLGRLVTTRDPENYVSRTIYNRFGEALDVRRYATAFTGTPQIGVNPTGNPDTVSAGSSPEVIAAYDHAAQLQEAADVAAVALATEQAAVAAILANPLPFFQNLLATLQAQRAVVQAQYDAASWADRILVYGPQLVGIDLEISNVNTNITRINNGQGLNSWGVDKVNAGYNVSGLQSQYDAAQAAADAALTDALALDAAQQGAGDFGVYSGTIYTYDRLGRVATKVDAQGYGESYAYDAFGQLVAFRRYGADVGSANYNETVFEYDRLGNLKKTTDAEGWYESSTYDAFGRQVSHTAKSYTNEKNVGGTTTYEYFKSGLLKSETLPVKGYDASGGETLAIKTSYEYDRRGNLVSMKEAEGLAEQRITVFTYDRLNRKLTTATPSVTSYSIDPATNALSSTTGAPTETITYDASGNVIRIVDAMGSRTVFFYDALNRKTVEINALGTYTAFAYDANGNVTSIKVYDGTVTVPANGGASSAAPAAPAGDKRETSFSYDGRNQMLTSTVVLPSGYKTGAWNGTAWTNATTTSLVTTYQYDYLGNAVKTVDPNGNSVFSYYDKLGRKTAQVDQEGYLTTWTYNSEGNVLTERRYATRFTGTPTTASPPSVSNTSDDRLTTYAYDQVGNRLSETRASVSVISANAGRNSVNSKIEYRYNGLGQVIEKSEATDDATKGNIGDESFYYTYDAAGRLKEEERPVYASVTGVNVSPKLNYFYNGLGNLTRTVQVGDADAAARITTYSYDAGGRLTSTVDAEGKTRFYRYDKAGRLVLEYYYRSVMTTNATLSASYEGIGYRYDALGRNLGQGFYKSSNSGSTWQFQTAANGVDSTAIEYNSFGDVTKVRINGIVQQDNAYDMAGRLWKSTSGDGIWKYFGYDKNGNQTLSVTSAGADTSGKTLAQAFAMVGQSDVNGTFTVYDKRNLATSVVEEGRQLDDSTTIALTTARTYNAFGEVATETDAAGATVTYTYNTMGKCLRVESPTVLMTMENGTTRYVKPSEDYYYDAAGRLVAYRDANGSYTTGGTETNGKSKSASTGNLTRLTLLAGTGYGGSEALIVKQTTADGGVTETSYDILGNARKTRVLLSGTGSQPSTDVWRTTEQQFDKLGRLIKAIRPGTAAGLYFYDSYAYDELGQLIEHGNSVMSTAPAGTTNYLDGNTELSTFDIQGRIVASRAYGGDITETTYTWDATLEAAGIGLTDTGGWIKETKYKNTLTTGVLTVTEKADTYGRVITRTDLDGRLHNFSYNLAGWMTKTYNSIAGAAEINYSYYNTGKVRGQIGNAPETLYKYDEAGRRRFESVRSYNWQTGTWDYLKQATVVYDKLGRITQFEDQGGPDIPYAKLVFGYDANGNVMSTASTYSPLDQYGNPGTQTTTTKHNRYDAGNRMVLADGTLSGTTVARGTAGKAMTYDKAGQRITTTLTRTSGSTTQDVQEIYEYDPAGHLQNRKETLDGGVTVTLRSTFTYDAMGRVLTQKDFVAGSTVNTMFDKTTTYNNKGQVSFEQTFTKSGSDTIRADATYTYLDYDGNYALGQVGKIDTINYKNGNNAQAADTLLQYRYDLYEKATLSQSIYKPDKTLTTTYYNNYQIDSWGYTRQVDITDGRSRAVIIKHDENNQILSREEDETSYNRGNPRQIYYRFDGRQLGEISNDGTTNIDYQASVDQRSKAPVTNPGPFMGGAMTSTPYTDFNQHYDAINSYQQSSSSRSSYTVQGGESLQAIAASVWGDASLWYSIADANGLSAGQQLTPGQTLVIPANVIRSHNNSGTFKAYDPGKVLGDISPTAPAPAPAQSSKKKGCGGLGMILLAVVAIAVTVVTAGAAASIIAPNMSLASGISTVLGANVLGGVAAAGGLAAVAGGVGAIAIGAGAAAIGSIASQGVGIATGIQEKFSWKGVALAAIGGGIGAALAPGGVLGEGGLFGAGNSAGEFVKGALGRRLINSKPQSH